MQEFRKAFQNIMKIKDIPQIIVAESVGHNTNSFSRLLRRTDREQKISDIEEIANVLGYDLILTATDRSSDEKVIAEQFNY